MSISTTILRIAQKSLLLLFIGMSRPSLSSSELGANLKFTNYQILDDITLLSNPRHTTMRNRRMIPSGIASSHYKFSLMNRASLWILRGNHSNNQVCLQLRGGGFFQWRSTASPPPYSAVVSKDSAWTDVKVGLSAFARLGLRLVSYLVRLAIRLLVRTLFSLCKLFASLVFYFRPSAHKSRAISHNITRFGAHQPIKDISKTRSDQLEWFIGKRPEDEIHVQSSGAQPIATGDPPHMVSSLHDTHREGGEYEPARARTEDTASSLGFSVAAEPDRAVSLTAGHAVAAPVDVVSTSNNGADPPIKTAQSQSSGMRPAAFGRKEPRFTPSNDFFDMSPTAAGDRVKDGPPPVAEDTDSDNIVQPPPGTVRIGHRRVSRRASAPVLDSTAHHVRHLAYMKRNYCSPRNAISRLHDCSPHKAARRTEVPSLFMSLAVAQRPNPDLH